MKHVPNLRNGLKWRDGRPRWEPSKANRLVGVRGRDLKDLAGRWVTDRGKAISMADARHDLAALYREARSDGAKAEDARETLAQFLASLTEPKTDDSRLMRANIADLIAMAADYLGSNPSASAAPDPAGDLDRLMISAQKLLDREIEASIDTDESKHVCAMIIGYFQKPTPDTAPSTIDAYMVQAKKLLAKFGREWAPSVTRGMIYNWYHNELRNDHSLATANQIIGATAGLFRWAANNDWMPLSPVTEIGMVKPSGRLVFWSAKIEQAFVRWCDESGFCDVADAVVGGCWIGARQIDMCAATLGALSGETWRYTMQKTRRKGLDALPGIMPQVAARVRRRREEIRQWNVRVLNPDAEPFLVDPRDHAAHDSDSIGARFSQARALAARAAAIGDQPDLAGIEKLQLRDTRDTCVTRLYVALGGDLDRICPWTGHARANAERILREHYIVLQEEGAVETAALYQVYARAHGFDL
jgi:hypothetical protein